MSDPLHDAAPVDPSDLGNVAPFGIGRTTRVWVGGGNREPRKLVESLVGSAARPTAGAIDVAIVLPTSLDELRYFSAKLRLRMDTGARLWVIGEADTPEIKNETMRPILEPLGFAVVRAMPIGKSCNAVCWTLPQTQ